MDVRFLIDEHIDHAIAAALRLRGYDVLTLSDAKLLGADDFEEILPFALAENRVLISRDADFLAMHARGDAHAGIVHWHGKKRNVKEAIHYVLQLGRKETSESMLGVVRYIKSKYP
jgi:predicted nuclease of predicted toxin-antitoxin system